MGDGFGGEGLLRGVDEGQIEVERCPGIGQDLFLEPICLLGSAAHEVALVGAFVELLGDREEHFDGAFGIGFRKPDIPEREYESALSGFEESAHRSQ